MNNYIENIGSTHLQNSSDFSILNQIKQGSKNEREQLKKVSVEFELIFVFKMINELDKTVDRTNSLFQESKYLDNLKSFMYNDIARTIASNPKMSLGIAKQMYTQLEKTVKG